MSPAYLAPLLTAFGLLLIFISLLWLIDIASEFCDDVTPLTSAQSAQLALAAPYFAVHGFSYETLQGKRPFARLIIRCLLYTDWHITSSASAAQTLEWLAAKGARDSGQGPAASRPPCAARPVRGSDIRAVPVSLDYGDAQKIVFEPQREFRALLAWDVVRLVFVARCCASLGLIDARQFWDYVERAGRLASMHFGSWRGWADAFLLGREVWTGEADGGYRHAVQGLLSHPGSIWKRVGWIDATGAGRHSEFVFGMELPAG